MPASALVPAAESGRSPPDSAVVILRIASRPGPAFQLDPSTDNIIGRGATSLVVLADRLASRRHAALTYDAATATWSLRDLDSRNGTWLDGVQISETSLADRQVIRVGTTELEFRTKVATEAAGASADTGHLVRHGPPDELQGMVLTRMTASAENARWPMLLYQSGIRLLANTSSWQVVCTTLELATEFTAATRFGWFTLTPSGHLQPVFVVPPGNGLEPLLAGTLAREVAAGHAAWVSLGTTDVAAVPIRSGDSGRALLVAAAPSGVMREADFDVLVMLANFAAASGAGTNVGAVETDPLDDDIAVSDDDDRFGGTIALTGADLAAIGIGSAGPAAPQVPSGAGSLRIAEWQRALIVEALRRSGGSVPDAAVALGMSRATLYRKLDAWGLTRGESPPAPP